MKKNKLERHLKSLKETHNLLNTQVDEIMSKPCYTDNGRVGALKLKKLHVKDQISTLERELENLM
jgi:hypothetical protein